MKKRARRAKTKRLDGTESGVKGVGRLVIPLQRRSKEREENKVQRYKGDLLKVSYLVGSYIQEARDIYLP